MRVELRVSCLRWMRSIALMTVKELWKLVTDELQGRLARGSIDLPVCGFNHLPDTIDVTDSVFDDRSLADLR